MDGTDQTTEILEQTNQEVVIKRGRGRPKGSANIRTKVKVAGMPRKMIKTLSTDEKLALLSKIARSDKTSNSDVIKAINAHTVLENGGESVEGTEMARSFVMKIIQEREKT